MGGSAVWDKHAEIYNAHLQDTDNRVSTRIVFPKILEIAGNLQGKRILDYGCGQGRFARKLHGLGGIVTAYDESAVQIGFAEKLDDGRGITYSASAEKVILENHYDAVLCFMVMICNPLKKAKKLLEEIQTTLRPGGKCIFVNTNTSTLGEKFTDFYSIAPEKIAEGAKYKTIVPSSKGTLELWDYFYSKKFLEKMFLQNGFAIENEEVVAGQFIVHIVSKK